MKRYLAATAVLIAGVLYLGVWAMLDQRRDQMLSDETAAASDEYPCHACERGSAWRFSA